MVSGTFWFENQSYRIQQFFYVILDRGVVLITLVRLHFCHLINF